MRQTSPPYKAVGAARDQKIMLQVYMVRPVNGTLQRCVRVCVYKYMYIPWIVGLLSIYIWLMVRSGGAYTCAFINTCICIWLMVRSRGAYACAFINACICIWLMVRSRGAYACAFINACICIWLMVRSRGAYACAFINTCICIWLMVRSRGAYACAFIHTCIYIWVLVRSRGEGLRNEFAVEKKCYKNSIRLEL